MCRKARECLMKCMVQGIVILLCRSVLTIRLTSLFDRAGSFFFFSSPATEFGPSSGARQLTHNKKANTAGLLICSGFSDTQRLSSVALAVSFIHLTTEKQQWLSQRTQNVSQVTNFRTLLSLRKGETLADIYNVVCIFLCV